MRLFFSDFAFHIMEMLNKSVKVRHFGAFDPCGDLKQLLDLLILSDTEW
jgi:hypothetical protein